jgi:hypothetical protein
MNKLKRYFYNQRDSAKRRGISFELSYIEWLDIWESSKKLEQRGRGKGKYCMMRNNDIGSYSKENVKIGLFEQNASELKNRKTGKNYAKTTLPPLKRLYSKVIIDSKTKCHIWTGNTNAGYGQTSFLGKKIGTHRLSYILQKGNIPQGMIICHVCDNPSCVNPAHLFLGTAKTNAEDKVAKNRQIKNTWSKGENHPCAKLNESNIIEIRNSNFNNLELSQKFNVTKSTISKIKNFRIWRNINVN